MVLAWAMSAASGTVLAVFTGTSAHDMRGRLGIEPSQEPSQEPKLLFVSGRNAFRTKGWNRDSRAPVHGQSAPATFPLVLRVLPDPRVQAGSKRERGSRLLGQWGTGSWIKRRRFTMLYRP